MEKMKETNFYNPCTNKPEREIRIERNDIEQALSWYHRMGALKTTSTDNKVYQDLCRLVAYMRSLEME